MSFTNFISEKLLLELSDVFTGQSLSKNLKFLNKSQFWTREQIDNYQNELLKKIINHAYTNVPFYHDLFCDLRITPDDIQTKADLVKLPIVTKEELKRNKGKHLALNIPKRELIQSGSSGSTGEPFQYYITKHSASFQKATIIRAWNWMGYRLGDKYVKLSMNPRNSKIKRIQDVMNNCLYLSSQQLSADVFRNFEKEIINFNPSFIRCYPVPLHFLAMQIRENSNSYTGNKLRAINTTGSTLLGDVRNEIESTFNVKIYDSYSCEGGSAFSECENHTYYHPAEEYSISEFLEDSYTLSDSDRPLRHIATDLHNYASPLIRYDTQDYVVLGDQKPCSCGRHFLNVCKIKGRDSDILVTPSGKYLIVENFVAYFENIQEVDQIQVVQDEVDEITINMVVNSTFNRDTHSMIENYWKEYIGGDVKIKIEIVTEIKLTPAGKRRTLIRNPKISINR